MQSPPYRRLPRDSPLPWPPTKMEGQTPRRSFLLRLLRVRRRRASSHGASAVWLTWREPARAGPKEILATGRGAVPLPRALCLPDRTARWERGTCSGDDSTPHPRWAAYLAKYSPTGHPLAALESPDFL